MGVVLPAVDVLGIEIDNFTTELVGSVAGDAGLAGAAGAVEEGRFGVITVEDGLKGAGEGVDFAVYVAVVSGHKLRMERACVGDHLPARVSTRGLSWRGGVSGIAEA